MGPLKRYIFTTVSSFSEAINTFSYQIFFFLWKKTAANKVQHLRDWDAMCLAASHLISLIKNLIHDDSFDD